MPISYAHEMQRKLIHLISLWIPIACYYFDKKTMLLLIGALALKVLVVDVGRFYVPIVQKIFKFFFGHLLRIGEEQGGMKLTGASYLVVGCFLTVLFFPKHVAVTALAILVISDTTSALVGRRWGKLDREVHVGVRTLFRDPTDTGSIYDELLVVHPPKLVIGGVLVKF